MTLEITFFDVQHGLSTYIKTPNGQDILHDLGTGNFKNGTFSPIDYLIENRRSLDYLIITHPHKDHINDILNLHKVWPKILRRNKNIPLSLVEEKIDNCDNEHDKNIFRKYLEINSNFNSPVAVDENPVYANNNGGVEINIFTPNKNDVNELNYYSLTTLIKYAKSKILLMGDNNKKSIDELLNNVAFLNKSKDIDILLTPHHGRESSYVSDFVSHLNPRLTIISDKKDDKEQSAVDKYSNKSRGWNVFGQNGKKTLRKCLTTRNDGTITVKMWEDSERPYLNVRTGI